MPAWLNSTSKQFEIRSIGQALNDGVLLFGFVRMILEWRIHPGALAAELDGCLASGPEEQMFGLLAWVLAEAEAWFDPGQWCSVGEAPTLP